MRQTKQQLAAAGLSHIAPTTLKRAKRQLEEENRGAVREAGYGKLIPFLTALAETNPGTVIGVLSKSKGSRTLRQRFFQHGEVLSSTAPFEEIRDSLAQFPGNLQPTGTFIEKQKELKQLYPQLELEKQNLEQNFEQDKALFDGDLESLQSTLTSSKLFLSYTELIYIQKYRFETSRSAISA